jgi:hypothetical protein
MSAISVVNTMTSRFWRQSEQPINNQLSTINRLRVRGPFGHMSFHLPDMATLRKALDQLKKHDVDLEDPGDEIGPEAPGSPIWVFGFTISMAIAGRCQSKGEC